MTVQNNSDGQAAGNVRDRIWLSSDTTLDGNDLLIITLDAVTIPLEAGGAYQRQDFDVPLPLSESTEGRRLLLIVETDASRDQPETDESNNTAVTSLVIQAFPSLPDLAVEDPHVVESGIQPGDQITIRWNTVNRGDAIAAGTLQQPVAVDSLQCCFPPDINVLLAPSEFVERESVRTA